MTSLELILGPARIAATMLMILAAWPKSGEPAWFLKSWPVGQAYSLLAIAIASAVAGVTLVISRLLSWPWPGRLAGARRRRRAFRFGDGGLAGQALKGVEPGRVVVRFAGLHGDAAERAMAERGTAVGCHLSFIGQDAFAVIDPGQCDARFRLRVGT